MTMSRALPKYRKGRIALIGGSAAVVLSGAVIAGSALAGQSGSDNSAATTKSAASAVNCPDVAGRFQAVPAAAQAAVNRELAQLTAQIQEANNRLATSTGQGGAGFVQNAILTPLKDKRVATINRIAQAAGTALAAQQVDTLATCGLGNAGNAGNAGGDNTGNNCDAGGAAQGNAQGNAGNNAGGAGQGNAGGAAAQNNGGMRQGQNNGAAGQQQGNGGGDNAGGAEKGDEQAGAAQQGNAGAAQGNAGAQGGNCGNGAGAGNNAGGGAAQQGNGGNDNAGGAADNNGNNNGGNNAGGAAQNNGNNNAGAVKTVNCPDVASRLRAVPAAAQAAVNRELAQLTAQIQEANSRLASATGQGGADSVRRAVLNPLKNARVATIKRIVREVGGQAGRRQVNALATCTVNQ
ncbi:hypothetical protein ABZX85_09440 [Streptomyces sp. NPDC004539]|uniref:hypothetical protein n=1 Tax=Streptomyces sp. NPDC004539 TaxID=3154280 RepID=UPI00339EC03A